jgi:putative ABC transport system permease protein
MSGLLQGLRYALRTLWKNPAFAAVVVLMLALGIGATTVVFTFFHAVLLRPLGFEKPEQLVQLWETRTEGSFQQMEFDWPDYVDIKAQQSAFARVGGYSGTSASLSGDDGAEQVRVGLASADFFETLGVRPILGQTFRTKDDLETKNVSVILPYGTWRRRFAADPKVIGRRLVLDGAPVTIVGVLPASFEFAPARSAEFWLSLHVEGWSLRRNGHWFYPVGRLKEGVSRQQAEAEIQTLSRQLAVQYPVSNAGVGTRLVDLREQIVGPMKGILIFLMGAIACVLLITCANVAGLLLARAVPRRKEISIRMALGARRVHIARQLLTESVLLALLSGLGGVLLAYWAVPAIVSLVPPNALLGIPQLQGLKLHGGILWFTLALSLTTGISFGLAPVLQAFKSDLRAEMQESSHGSAGLAHRRVRNILVVSEVSLAVVLLAAAGLMLRSLGQVMNVDPGFKSENLLTAAIALPETKYPTGPKQLAMQRQMLQAVGSLPGVKQAGAVTVVPLSGSGNTSRFDVEGHPKASGGEEYEANTRTVTQNYFLLMQIPLLAGRFFDSQDREKSEKVVVVNRAMANMVFPGQDPIGKRINFTYTNEPNLVRIVGVVGNEHVDRVDLPPSPVIYDCFEQSPGSYFSVLLRTDKDPLALAGSVVQSVRELEPDAPVFEVNTMAGVMAASPTMMLRAYPAYLIGGFAAVALLLALLGLYGVLAYGVAQRTRELGLRMALGAQQGDVLRLILQNGLKLTMIGTMIGIVAALIVARLIASLLFGVAPTDFATFATVCILLLFAAAVASLIPAYRATKVDPMVALRCE